MRAVEAVEFAWERMARNPPRGILVLLTLIAGTGLSGCSGQKPVAAQSQRAAEAAVPGGLPEVLATVGSDQITMADVRARVGEDLDKLESGFLRSRHRLVETALQDILRERVVVAEAKQQNQTVDQLLESEAGGSLEPTEVEIAAWYQDNRARTGGRALDQIRGQIADFLRKQRREQALEKLELRLTRDRNVAVHFEPYRLTLDNEGAPAIGPANAPVTLVEFSDFQCPFCGRFFPTLKELEKNFGDRLRIVYRQYPISNIHPNAFKAAEASLCANDQGKFWEMHDLMFQQQSRLAVMDLKQAAGGLGMSQKKFDECLDSGRYTEQVQKDLREGSRIGVNGTPALFVNGIPIEGGAVPYETVARAIERELQRAAR